VAEKRDEGRLIFGIRPMLILFAAEYILQGIANPFQGITYQPFFRHFHVDYGLDEAATQNLFAKSYLAWAFKPVIGFGIDALGKTKIVLLVLLGTAAAFFALSPLLDHGPMIFFWMMFVLAVVLACTDVVVDRASVVEGDEEAKATGKSKAATVGLNQAVCWIAIYGSLIFASVSGGYIAEHFQLRTLLMALALVPSAVLFIAWRLPRDRAATIPLTDSIKNFWVGLNTGPLLWVVLFYFLFHFQPQGGALWNNYLMENQGFTQTQMGISDGAGYVGYLLGTIAFARWGVRLQDRIGLKRLFMIFIPLSALWNLTQIVMVDPTFTHITDSLAAVLPLPREDVRLGFLTTYQLVLYAVNGFIRMSTFSLVGVVIPTAAAGSLFAGFMSVANLGYSFSYSTGSWLYSNGMKYPWIASAQMSIFGVPANKDGEMSIAMLTLIGSLAYFLAFVVVQKLPDEKETRSSEDVEMMGPERFARLSAGLLQGVNIVTPLGMVAAFLGLWFGLSQDPIASAILSFFAGALVRKAFLDSRVAALA
jgi:MFS family permease